TAGAGMRRCLLGWVGAYRWPDCCKRESSCELNQASRSFFNCVWHEALDVIAAGVTVLSAVGRRRRMMVFSGVASQCEERGAMPAGTNFEIAATIVPAGTLVPPKRVSCLVSGSYGCPTPVELCAVGPDAVQDASELAGHGDRGLLASDAFDQLGSPTVL